MKRTSFVEMHCSLARGLELMGDWWSPLIIRDLFLGVTRFEDLIEDLGVSRNLLTSRLKALEDHGIIARRAYQQRPKRFDYLLTEAGRDLVPVIVALTAWGDRWACPPGGRPILFKHRACGCEFEPTVCCSACGEPVGFETIEVAAGPGGKASRGTKIVAKRLAKI